METTVADRRYHNWTKVAKVTTWKNATKAGGMCIKIAPNMYKPFPIVKQWRPKISGEINIKIWGY